MRKHLITLAGLLLLEATPKVFAANLSVILSGEVRPGVYGQVEYGDVRPAVVYERPIVIHREREYVRAEPIYLHVPPGHAHHWAQHCGYYNACGRPVYFVRSEEYSPHYRRYERERRYYDNHPRQEYRDDYRDDRHHGGHGNH